MVADASSCVRVLVFLAWHPGLLDGDQPTLDIAGIQRHGGVLILGDSCPICVRLACA